MQFPLKQISSFHRQAYDKENWFGWGAGGGGGSHHVKLMPVKTKQQIKKNWDSPSGSISFSENSPQLGYILPLESLPCVDFTPAWESPTPPKIPFEAHHFTHRLLSTGTLERPGTASVAAVRAKKPQPARGVRRCRQEEAGDLQGFHRALHATALLRWDRESARLLYLVLGCACCSAVLQ